MLNTDTDDLFGSSFGGSSFENEFYEDEGFSVDSLRTYLSESKTLVIDDSAGGDWNFIIIRLQEGWSVKSFISSINKKISPYGVTAVDWRVAAGTSAILLLLVKALFNAGLFLVSVAGIIAAINVLLISVFRRTREIGTLRAIGASDTYIRSMIICENLIIALIAGLIGVSGGLLFFKWINELNLNIYNGIFVSLIGGSVLRFEFIPRIAVYSFIAAIVLGIVSSIYPIEYAVRIEPMAAVRKG